MLDPRKTTLPATWATDFVLALRTREVTGAAIGAALREVESHCTESGQSPQDAFGDATAYADSLTHLPRTTPAGSNRRLARTLAPSAIGLLGMTVTLDAVTAWRSGVPVSVQWGSVIGVAVLVGGVAVLAGWPQLIRRRGLVVAIGVATMAGAITALVQVSAPIAQLPPMAAIGVGAAAVLGQALWQDRTVHRDLQDDLIADPLDPRPTRMPTGGIVATVWLLPIATAVLALFSLVLPVH